MSEENKSAEVPENIENVNEPQAELSPAAAEPDVSKAQFSSFDGENSDPGSTHRMDMLLDVGLPVSIELGRARIYIKEILELERGSMIE